MNFLYSITHTNCTTNNERTDSMICKNCNAYNDSRANFCCKCGGELYHSAMVTSPVTDKVTAYSIPTMGVRAFSGMGNGYLQSAIQNVVSSGYPNSDTYHTYPTGADVYKKNNGSWICPDCGEENDASKIFCTSCGKYR